MLTTDPQTDAAARSRPLFVTSGYITPGVAGMEPFFAYIRTVWPSYAEESAPDGWQYKNFDKKCRENMQSFRAWQFWQNIMWAVLCLGACAALACWLI